MAVQISGQAGVTCLKGAQNKQQQAEGRPDEDQVDVVASCLQFSSWDASTRRVLSGAHVCPFFTISHTLAGNPHITVKEILLPSSSFFFDKLG